MDDPVTGGLLPDPLLHEGLLAAEELHGQLVVGRLEQGLQLVLDEALLDLLAGEARAQLLLRRAIQGGIVHPEVDLPTPLVIHLVACTNKPDRRISAVPRETRRFNANTEPRWGR